MPVSEYRNDIYPFGTCDSCQARDTFDPIRLYARDGDGTHPWFCEDCLSDWEANHCEDEDCEDENCEDEDTQARQHEEAGWDSRTCGRALCCRGRDNRAPLTSREGAPLCAELLESID